MGVGEGLLSLFNTDQRIPSQPCPGSQYQINNHLLKLSDHVLQMCLVCYVSVYAWVCVLLLVFFFFFSLYPPPSVQSYTKTQILSTSVLILI